MIVGKAWKLRTESIHPTVTFLRRTAAPDKIETVYLLAPYANARFVRLIANAVADLYQAFADVKLDSKLRFPGGRVSKVKQYLMILRARNRQTYIPKEPT